MPRLFISYKRADKKKVFPIKDKIEVAIGEPCWIDLDGIESDAQFSSVIMHAIDRSEIFLFMYSKRHSKIQNYTTDWTVRELSYALKKKKRIVFINIDNSPMCDWLEFMFPQQQQVDATSSEMLQSLIQDIQKWLSVPTNISNSPIVPEKKWFQQISIHHIISYSAIGFLVFLIISCIWFGVIKGDKSLAIFCGTRTWNSPQYIVSFFKVLIPIFITDIGLILLFTFRSYKWAYGLVGTIPFIIWNVMAHPKAFKYMMWPSWAQLSLIIAYCLFIALIIGLNMHYLQKEYRNNHDRL